MLFHYSGRQLLFPCAILYMATCLGWVAVSSSGGTNWPLFHFPLNPLIVDLISPPRGCPKKCPYQSGSSKATTTTGQEAVTIKRTSSSAKWPPTLLTDHVQGTTILSGGLKRSQHLCKHGFVRCKT